MPLPSPTAESNQAPQHLMPWSGRSVFLTGMMGSGKSTVGRLLAQVLHVPFMDLDTQLEARCGTTVAELFARLTASVGGVDHAAAGEAAFRQLERNVLLEVAAQAEHTPMVVATGGGAVILPDNRTAMAQAGEVVYLEVSLPTLVERLSAPTQRAARPLLAQGGDLQQRLEHILGARTPAYLACSHRVDANQSPCTVANAIATWLNQSRDVHDAP